MKVGFFFFLVGSILILSSCNSKDKEIFSVYEQYYPVSLDNKELFFKLEIWGISNNHTRVILTEEKKNFDEYTSEKDYIFKEMLPVAFIVRGKEIHVYSFTEAEVPSAFNPDVRVIQHKVTRSEYEKVIKENENITIIDYPTPSN